MPADNEPDIDRHGDSWFPLRRTRWLTALFYAIVFAWILFLFIEAWDYQWSDKTFPLIVGIPTLALIVIEVVAVLYPDVIERLTPDSAFSLMGDGKQLEDIGEMVDSDRGRSEGEEQKYGIIMVGWVLLLLVMIYLLGFAYAFPIYIFVFGMYFVGDARTAAAVTIGFNLFMYFLFVLILDIQPWTGVLGLPNYLAYLP